MEDISVPPDNDANRPRGGRGGTGSLSPFVEPPPPDISVTYNESALPREPSTNRDDPTGGPNHEIPNRDDPTGDPNHEIPNSKGFSPGSSQFAVFPYDPDPFPPFWEFESSKLTPASGNIVDESMDVGDQVRDPSAPGSDSCTDDVISNEGEERDGEKSEGFDNGEEDWSLASSDQWQLVSDYRQDGHSTPSGFVMASAGSPSIPDDLMSFSTDQDEESSDVDEVPSDQDDGSSFLDHLSSDPGEVSFYDSPGDVLSDFGVPGLGSSTAIMSKNPSHGHLSREDTLEEETEGSEHRMFYDLNDNEGCTTPLGDPLFSSIVFGINEDPTGTVDIYHDTEDGEEDMETPRAPSIAHINNVTSLHSWCSASHDDADMAAKEGGSRGLSLSNVPQRDSESLPEESFFDSGNFQRVDDVYECYPAKIQTRKRNLPIGAGIHHKSWDRGSLKRRPKRGRAKRKSKNKRRWKLHDQLTDFYPFGA